MKIILHLLLSLMLLHSVANSPKRAPQRKPKESIKKELAHKLLDGFVMGSAGSLPPLIYKKYRDLALLHLFTPSGLHFTSFLRPLKLTQKISFSFFKGQGITLFSFLLLCFSFLIFYLPKLYSLKRIVLLRFCRSLCLSLGKVKIDSYLFFLLVMTLDLLVGTYQYSPGSFSYSFLFLGIIYLFKDRPLWQISLAFYLAQLLASFFTQEQLPFLTLFFGPLLTALFTFLFPLFILLKILSPLYLFSWPILLFHQLVLGSHFLCDFSPRLFTDTFLLLPLFLFFYALYQKKISLKMVSFASILIYLNSPSLCFSSKESPLFTSNHLRPYPLASFVHKEQFSSFSIQRKFDDGSSCREKNLNSMQTLFWSCRKPQLRERILLKSEKRAMLSSF